MLRPPIGAEQEGEIYAVAITPDGRRVFAAGATGGSWDGTFSIYLFDTRRGALAGRLPGLPSPVYALAVSPDGSRFAAGLARGGVRVWDAASGKPIFEDAAYAGPVRNLAFDRQGRLYAAAADGKLRAYDRRWAQVRREGTGAGPAAVGPRGVAGRQPARGRLRECRPAGAAARRCAVDTHACSRCSPRTPTG